MSSGMSSCQTWSVQFPLSTSVGTDPEGCPLVERRWGGGTTGVSVTTEPDLESTCSYFRKWVQACTCLV